MSKHSQQFAASLGLLVFSLFVSYFHYPNQNTILPSASELTTLKKVGATQGAVAPHFDPGLIVSTSTFSVPVPSQVPSKPKAPVIKKPAPQPKKSLPVHTETPKTAVVSTRPVSAPVIDTPVPGVDDPSEPLRALRGALVNILCISHKSGLRGSTGSGVLIDSRGIILTVAHVAQSELLSEALGSDVFTCTVRTGSPARNAYHAKLIYISEPWLRKNSTTLISSQPTGTGENDFALLAITDSANGNPLPSQFPFVTLSDNRATVGDSVGIGGYAAQYLTSPQIRTALSPTFVMGVLTGAYTFTSTTQDVLALLGHEAAQEGSSGGGVVNTDGNLIGLITTSEISGSADTRHLRVITPGHIERSFSADTGKDLLTYYTSTSPSTLVSEYASKVQELGSFLADAIGIK